MRRRVVEQLRGRAWVTPGAVLVLALALRVVNLGRVPGYTFDEAYYVPQGWSLIRYGVERKFSEGGQDAFARGDLDAVFTSGGDFVVHPPLGKWLIGLGELAGPTEPWTWRISAAIAGAIIAALVTAIGVHLSGSWKWGAFAGILLAIEGTSLVQARTGILDTFLTLFVTAGAAAALKDRDSTASGWWRPWRLTAAISLGLAAGVKFSGAIFLIAYLWLVISWDLRARQTTPEALARTARNFVLVLLAGALAYTVTWTGWFISPDGYGRDSRGNILSSWIHTQLGMLDLAGAINSPHQWQAAPWAWLIQARPTMFYTVTAPCRDEPGATCHQTITSLGTVPIWWLGILSVIGLGWLLARRRDSDAALVLTFFACAYLPWWFLPERTIFAFYTVAIAPFMVLAITLVLLRWHRSGSGRARFARPAALGVGALALLWLISYWPVYTAAEISADQWSHLLFWPGWQ